MPNPSTPAPQTTNPKTDVAPAYGEADIEAKSMTEAARQQQQGADPHPASHTAASQVPPPGVAMPAEGTTETDLARNLADQAARKAAQTP